jgi:hypothetical protein
LRLPKFEVRLPSTRCARAAQALDCVLVYALIPRESLEKTVTTRARAVALKDMAALDQTMALENQSVEPAERDAQIDSCVREEINLPRLWDGRE